MAVDDDAYDHGGRRDDAIVKTRTRLISDVNMLTAVGDADYDAGLFPPPRFHQVVRQPRRPSARRPGRTEDEHRVRV